MPHTIHNTRDVEAEFRKHYCINSLIVKAREFPELSNSIIESILKDPNQIPSGIDYDFEHLLFSFPAHRRALFNLVLDDLSQFRRIINCIAVFSSLAQFFPEYKRELIAPILNSSDLYDDFVNYRLTLEWLIALYPEHTDELLQPVLTRVPIFQKIVSAYDELLHLTEKFPNYAGNFFSLVFNNLDLYKTMMTREVFEKILTSFPQYRKACFAPLLENNWSEFKGCIGAAGLFSLAKNFPEHLESLSRFILSDPEEFKRLIKTEEDLKKAAEAFPNIPAFQTGSLKEAFHCIKKENYEKITASFLMQARRTNALFKVLNRENIEEISMLVGNNTP